MEEEEIEQKDDRKFQEIIAEGKADQEVTTTTEIKKSIKGIAGEKDNWKAECIREDGQEAKWYRVQQLYSTREQNFNVMEGNKNKVSLQRRKQRKDTRKSKRNISDEHSV